MAKMLQFLCNEKLAIVRCSLHIKRSLFIRPVQCSAPALGFGSAAWQECAEFWCIIGVCLHYCCIIRLSDGQENVFMVFSPVYSTISVVAVDM